MSIRHQAFFARRLATLLGAGISLPEAFSFIAKSSRKKKNMHATYHWIIEKIKSGQTASDALSASKIFHKSLVHLVEVGESSGSISEALNQAALMLERRDGLTKKIIGIMIYPVFIGCATLGIAGFLVMYIFPKIVPLVTGMNIQIPLLTQGLMIVSALLIRHWPIVFGGGAGTALLVFIIWKLSSVVRESIRRIVFLVPIVGSIFKGYILIEIFSSLSLLLEHGELLPISLESIRDGTSYTEYEKLFTRAIEVVNKGAKLSDAFAGQRLVPELAADLIETGERTGGVAAACAHIARIYESEVEDLIQRISRIIEPVLMLCMGGVVGSIALSIVLPIYEITNHLNH